MIPGPDLANCGASDEILEQASWPENTFQGQYLQGKDSS
jgi:hypothetical protein